MQVSSSGQPRGGVTGFDEASARLAQGSDSLDWGSHFFDATVAPVVAAVVAASGLWVKERLLDRDEHLQRRRAIEQGLTHLSHLKTWLETQTLAGDTDRLQEARREVQDELLELRPKLLGALQDEPQSLGPSAARRALAKLVLVPLHSSLARATRLLYWFAVFTGRLGTTSVVSVVTTSGPDFASIAGSIAAAVLFAFMVMLPAVALHALARFFERRAMHASAGAGRGGPPELAVPEDLTGGAERHLPRQPLGSASSR